MKKTISLLLAVLLLLGLCACGGGEAAPQQTQPAITAFSVGYGQADISTDKPVQLYGYAAGGERLSQKILDPLYVTCVAFTDTDNTTVLLLAIDMCHSFKITSEVRELIAQQTGVPVSNVLFTASHSHSAPAMDDTGDPNIRAYNEIYKSRCLQAAKDALADRKPAQMHTTFTRPQGLNFIRHYILTDGTRLGVGVGEHKQEELYGHTGAPDNLMQLVKFTREGGKDIVMINWQGHYFGTKEVDYYAISADYPGVMRKAVEEKLDCQSIFILGGSGNQNTKSNIRNENKAQNYIEMGNLLAEEAVKAAANFQAAETGKIHLEENLHKFEGNDSVAPLYAFGFGDFGCVTVPFEVFASTNIAVRDNSKFKYTFVATCANGALQYLPDETAFEYDCMEVQSNTRFPKGTAEALRDQLNTMLETVFTQTGNAAKEKDPGYITEFKPTTDGVEYLNPTPGKLDAGTPANSGYYQLTLMNLSTNQTKTFLVLNQEVLQQVLAKETLKLLLDGSGVIVGVAE